MAPSSFAPMRRLRISSLPPSVSKRHCPSCFTRGMGKGQPSAPSCSTALASHSATRFTFSLRRPGLTADYSNRALDRSRVVAAVHAPGGRTGTIARLPDGGVGRLDARTLTGTARPPIGWARLIVAPDDEVVIVPIEVVVKPCPDREAEPEGDERAAEWPLVIDHVRLIHGHIDHLRVDREDFNSSAVGNNVLLRGGLQVAQRLGLGTEPLNGIHHVLLLIQERLSQGRRP